MNTIDVLRCAKEEIVDESQWWTGGLICNTTGRVCALGAIAKVLFGPDRLREADDDQEGIYDALIGHPAVAALDAVIQSDHGEDDVDRVFYFNDRHEENHHAKVIDAFDRAILSLSVDTKVEPLPERVEVPA